MSDTSKSYPIRGLTIAGLLAMGLLVGGLGQWAATAEISGAVIASGSIKVEQNRQVVQHPYGGVVDEVLVSEGDLVEEDALLLRLEPSELLAERQIVEGQLAETLARRSRYSAERDEAEEVTFAELLFELSGTHVQTEELINGQKRLFEARLVNLRARISRLQERIGQIQSQIDGIEAQQSALQEQLVLIGQELENQQSLLSQGLAQSSRVLSLQREQSRLRGQAGALTAQKAQAEGQVTELGLEILNQRSARREEAITTLRDLQVRELELIERRNLILQRLSRLEVRAPVSGLVYDLNVFARKSVIRAADPLMYLIPQSQPLVISAQVAPSDIDQVYLNQPVSLNFSSFNQRTTPTLFGTVSTVSADSFVDPQTGRSYYVVEARLNKGEIDRLPEGNVLVPGMPVETFIQTNSRTPFAYLLQPFTDYLNRAFRES
ncbi:HlyD family type I secretion periplasmic adaptor subunit (plasmid) [Phaeobacter inhibens]|uniref:HlyD family type I secretion periplasmic adaptor subunit n=1 Tax=Phaeobacter TaxID=302485 RepID=UPI000160EC5E|nr:HlyD family type I secretion periplasmic adaptor subunit [Phaeobacter inhibens]AFO89737.1 type I secretion membrane fusion protein [Phaeobacter inhibens 2.10]AXT44667.1 HlyD family type I secretion periplasmic adaptor subunit [Phaeobacter inhibens]